MQRKKRSAKIYHDATVKEALQEKLASVEADNWQQENHKAIKVYNDFVEEHGCFSDDFREQRL